MRTSFWIVPALVFLSCIPGAKAGTIYRYVGNDLILEYGNAYGTSNRVTIEFVFDGQNTGLTNFLFSPASFTLNDGVNTLVKGAAGFEYWEISTDGVGNIQHWWINVMGGGNQIVSSRFLNGAMDGGYTRPSASAPAGSLARVFQNPGTWTPISDVPEPATFFLLLAPCAAVLVVARSRNKWDRTNRGSV